MEKKAQRKSYKDPAMNKIIQEKAAWNKDVSSLINDLIHFKKSMNGWPSKYYKERTRITQPVPVDLSGILNQIAGEFQDIANRGNGILQEQSDFSKAHISKHRQRTLDRLEQTHGPVDVPKPTTPAPGSAPDLNQQLGKGLASFEGSDLIKLANDLEIKYFLESQASNPITRFVTRLFNPKFGFGEAARIRRLRMTMLDNCVKAFKTLKVLQAEVVKSGKQSLVNSHKMMTLVWNYWNIVNRLLITYKALRPGEIKETGGQLEDPELARERRIEKGEEAEEDAKPAKSEAELWQEMANENLAMIKDYREHAPFLGALVKGVYFHSLNSTVEGILATPKKDQFKALSRSNIGGEYNAAVATANQELGTNGQTFKQIVEQYKAKSPAKTAQELRGQLGKLRHQLLPGATSGSRLEIYKLIEQIKKDLNTVMDLLEAGFDKDKLGTAISQVNREMSTLRTVMRSLYYSEKPEEAPSTFF